MCQYSVQRILRATRLPSSISCGRFRVVQGCFIPGEGVAGSTLSPTGTKVPVEHYVRQRLLSEPVFHLLSRVTREILCDMYSRYEEQTIQYFSSPAGQKRVTTYRALFEATHDNQDQVGEMLPKPFHAHPAKSKAKTIDGLAVVARKGRPDLMLTMKCNGSCEGIQANLLPGQTANDRSDQSV